MLLVSVDQTVDQTVLIHSKKLCFAGAACDLHTNSSELARVLESLSISTGDIVLSGFNMRVVVNESSGEAVR